MKKAKFNTRLAIAGALFSGILMMVAVFGFTSETVVDNNNIEAIQLADNSMGDLVIFDGKCGGDEKAKEGDKKGDKKEGKCGEGKCGDDKAKAKEGDKKEGKCGEGKCGGDEKAKDGDKKESKCGEGKCG